jgi:hypothetical protein
LPVGSQVAITTAADNTATARSYAAELLHALKSSRGGELAMAAVGALADALDAVSRWVEARLGWPVPAETWPSSVPVGGSVAGGGSGGSGPGAAWSTLPLSGIVPAVLLLLGLLLLSTTLTSHEYVFQLVRPG